MGYQGGYEEFRVETLNPKPYMIGPIKGDTRSLDLAAIKGDTRSLDYSLVWFKV